MIMNTHIQVQTGRVTSTSRHRKNRMSTSPLASTSVSPPVTTPLTAAVVLTHTRVGDGALIHTHWAVVRHKTQRAREREREKRKEGKKGREV
jgi:hypothetical protein